MLQNRSYTYNKNGSVVEAEEDTRKTAYTYDSMGRITQERKLTLVSGSWVLASTVSNTYDITGNRTQVDYPNSVTLTSTYDKRNLLTSVTKGTQVTGYSYDNNGSRIGMTLPNGVTVTYTFDDAKRLTKIENVGGSNIYTAEYRLDKIGQKVRIDESGTNPARTLKYTYDDVYRLMSEYDSLGTGTTTSYVYDDVGNRVSKDVNGTAYTYTVDQLNRVTAVSGGSTIAWTYDANGNTATKTTGGVTYTYSYDRENRLADVSTTSGSIFSAVYDYRSRRLEKTENSSTVSYLYDGGVSVLEYDGQDSLTKVLVRGSGYGGGIGSVIYTADDANGTNRRFFLYNALGSTSAMTNDAMTVTSTSSYDGWGKEVASTGSSETDRKFCTKERSASIGLDYFGFRYYDYDLGRFTTRDPSGYPDGPNNYLYCSNDPVNKIDPLGLKSEDIDKKINSFEKAEKARYTLQAQMSNLNYLININKKYKSPKAKKKVERLKFKVDVIKKIMKKDDKRRAEALKDKDIRDYDAVKKLLMAEIRKPSHRRYSEKGALKGMRAIASILINRLNYKNKKAFYAKGAKTLFDIIASRGQFAGFSSINGKLKIDNHQESVINDTINSAFTGKPGKTMKFYNHAVNTAKDAVKRTLKDPYANKGGTYFIRTGDSRDPGGRSKYIEHVQGNKYYTLKQ